MSSTVSVFSRLPPELLCEIFEHAAYCDNATALVLSLVSSWVHDLVEPLLYHTIVLSSARALQAFLATVASKSPAFAQRRVRNLGIFAMGPAAAIVEVLEACRGVDSLACGFFLPGCKGLSSVTPDAVRIRALECTKEQHLLGMSCRDGWDPSVVGSGVTHLRVHLPASSMSTMFPLPADPVHPPTDPFQDQEDQEEEMKGWSRLALLPALTHLAIVYRPSARYPVATVFEQLQRLLVPPSAASPSMPNLQLILVQVVGTFIISTVPSPSIAEMNDLAKRTGGSALKIVAERAPASAAVQWEDAVRRGRSVWQDAEEEVTKRMEVAKQKTT